LWEAFQYELACAELCGRSHYSMRRVVRIVSEEEYNVWLGQQQSYYLNNIRGKEGDPNQGKLLDIEIKQNRVALNTAVEQALAADATEEVRGAVIPLNFIQFETGSSRLTEDSRYQLSDLVEVMNKYPLMRIEIAGHTDNVGDDAANLKLSQDRAASVRDFIVAQGIAAGRITATGYGETRPLESNDTEAGQAANR